MYLALRTFCAFIVKTRIIWMRNGQVLFVRLYTDFVSITLKLVFEVYTESVGWIQFWFVSTSTILFVSV
jgi:hypothetical protein